MFWSRKKDKNKLTPPNASETPPDTKIESADIGSGSPIDKAESPANARNYWNSGLSAHDWVSEMFQDEWKKGTFDHLAGKGKPIEVPSGDVTNSMLKEANYLPSWLMLQHEIRDKLRKLTLRIDSGNDQTLDQELAELNAMIRKYNSAVPHHALQKLTLTKVNALRQLKHWE